MFNEILEEISLDYLSNLEIISFQEILIKVVLGARKYR